MGGNTNSQSQQWPPDFPIGPYNPLPVPRTANPGGSPGLITSTGGLYGISGVLLTPVLNNTTRKSYILLMDPSNFDCEEPAEYDFPQAIPQVQGNPYQEGCNVNCHLIKLKYRELGIATFVINVTTYQKSTDAFTSYPYIISIPPIPLKGQRKKTFPDDRIHTLFIPINVPGERPQVTINSDGDAGPYSITSLTLCGLADEMPQF
jgi:hypothetical protein